MMSSNKILVRTNLNFVGSMMCLEHPKKPSSVERGRA